MLPVHNKPSVQWIVEELNDAGINDIIFITSKGQDMVKEYFKEHTWYDEELRNRDKHDHADHLEEIRSLAQFHFVEQAEQLGDGHAILQAKDLVADDEPSIVIFGDCLYQGENMIKNFIQHYQEHQKSLIAVQHIPLEEAHQYGIIMHKEGHDHIIETMLEKPDPKNPNNPNHPNNPKHPTLPAIIGRYILNPSIWKHLEAQHATSGEARLIDAFQALQQEEDIHAVVLDGTWLDTGTHEGLQRASEFFRRKTS